MSAAGVKTFLEKENKKKVCYIYQDDEFGAEVKAALEKMLTQANLKLVEEAGYKRGATDFSAQVARVQRGDCDLLMLGAVPPAAVSFSPAAWSRWPTMPTMSCAGPGPEMARWSSPWTIASACAPPTPAFAIAGPA